MKLIKKILRLLPCLFIIGALISCIFYNINLQQSKNPVDLFAIENGAWDVMDDSLRLFIDNSSFNSLFDWFTNNVSNSYFIYFSFYILCYELFLSLMFLMFDCINFVFIWANKFINKGVDIE